MAEQSEHYDVAIVGGGISGVYTGWRIVSDWKESSLLPSWSREGQPPSVAVFEASDRIGGRLLSAQSEYAPQTVCEIGGMRYVSSQKLVSSLVENKLKLPRHEQIVDQPGNLAFLRGKPMRNDQLSDHKLLPYDLTWAEQQLLAKNGAASLIGSAVAKILPQVNTMAGEQLREELKTAIFDGTPLYQHGFWNLLARVMSTEAYQLARTMVGYDSLGANANAVDMILEYFEFTPGVKYYLLDDGYDTVPWILQKQFTQAGGRVHRNATLKGFEADKEGVTLTFANGRTVSARAIVLAMPRRSIELLEQRGPVLDPEKSPRFQELLNTVEPIPLYKIFVVYPFPWWQSVGVSQGRSLTDLPVHQCYYWPTGPKGTMLANGPGIVMAYNDQTAVEFWGGLAATGKFAPKHAGCHEMTAEYTASLKPVHKTDENDFTKYLRKNWKDHKAARPTVAEIHRQLKAMHDQDYAPEPIDAAFMDWSEDPYGGGVHFWNVGPQSFEVLKEMVHPVKDVPCYICGEAWSTNQTWVEGALQTAEILLQEHLRFPCPSWSA
jgi:monoamine oxidase